VLNNISQITQALKTQIIPLAVMGLLTLGLALATAVEKFSTETEVVAIQQMRAPAKISFNWFGAKAIVQEEADMSNIYDELPTADIDARLLGVIIAGEASSATVKFGGSKEVVHFKGDKLNAKTTIIDIQGYRLVVRQGGVNKQMLMQKPDSIIEQSKGISTGSGSADKTSGFSLANMFGAVPVMVQGSTGFKVNNLSTEMQELADIQEGDIISQVDGVPISEIMANPAMWLKFSSSTSLPLSVMRDNQMQIIYINASSLSAKMMPSLGL
jgi:type II secretory pathway component PulC